MRGRRALVLPLLVLAGWRALAADPDWSVQVTPYGQVFPALELSQARRQPPAETGDHVLGGGTGLIGVRVRARHDGERIALRIDGPELGGGEFTATLAHAGVEYQLRPPLDWDVTRLRSITAPRATRLAFALTRDGADAGAREVAISLRPLDEALYFVRDGGDSVDLSWIFAAYVDERDPVVDRVLAAALASGIVARFDAYAAADTDSVYRQAWAVWHALAARDIR